MTVAAELDAQVLGRALVELEDFGVEHDLRRDDVDLLDELARRAHARAADRPARAGPASEAGTTLHVRRDELERLRDCRDGVRRRPSSGPARPT